MTRTDAVSKLFRNVPFLTSIEMSPFLLSASFCLLWLFSQKISLQDAPGTTILFSVDLRDPGFSDPLAWPGAPPCVARRAERLGRSVGPSQRRSRLAGR